MYTPTKCVYIYTHAHIAYMCVRCWCVRPGARFWSIPHEAISFAARLINNENNSRFCLINGLHFPPNAHTDRDGNVPYEISNISLYAANFSPFKIVLIREKIISYYDICTNKLFS